MVNIPGAEANVRRCRRARAVVYLGLVLALPFSGLGQGTEDFENLPPSATNYTARTWTGTDGVTWNALGARTDQELNDRAICFGNTAHNPRNVTSPVYANGMGVLSFTYVRGFTTGGGRTLQVWVNDVQQGPNITVDPNSDTPVVHTQTISIVGNVQLQVRSTGSAQVIVDDIS
ncbi:MAG: hypothetical protein RBT71_09105, partial [Flavobacteriales bacterium]|nr:hypothetical protein [Flavobacteriales bacterium]